MKYLERRGSGLKKILSETEKLPGYTEHLRPEFYSTPSDFRVVLKNINYNLSHSTQVNTQDSTQDKILAFCVNPRTKIEIATDCGFKSIKSFSQYHLAPLLESGLLRMTIPDKPSSKNQKYIITQK